MWPAYFGPKLSFFSLGSSWVWEFVQLVFFLSLIIEYANLKKDKTWNCNFLWFGHSCNLQLKTQLLLILCLMKFCGHISNYTTRIKSGCEIKHSPIQTSNGGPSYIWTEQISNIFRNRKFYLVHHFNFHISITSIFVTKIHWFCGLVFLEGLLLYFSVAHYICIC